MSPEPICLSAVPEDRSKQSGARFRGEEQIMEATEDQGQREERAMNGTTGSLSSARLHFLGSCMSLDEALELFRSLDRVTAEYE